MSRPIGTCDDCSREVRIAAKGLCSACYKRELFRANNAGKYTLTAKQYRWLRLQPCAICGTSHEMEPRQIDHDHTTDRVRGPLCQQCNILVGWLETAGPERVTLAMAWLQYHKENQPTV